MSVGVSVCFIINMNQDYFNFSVFIGRMYLLNVSQLIQTQFWGTVNFNRLFWPVWTMAPELQSGGTCRHSRNPPGESPGSLVSREPGRTKGLCLAPRVVVWAGLGASVWGSPRGSPQHWTGHQQRRCATSQGTAQLLKCQQQARGTHEAPGQKAVLGSRCASPRKPWSPAQ